LHQGSREALPVQAVEGRAERLKEERTMLRRSSRAKELTTPILAAIAATRVMLGSGIGLLASRLISRKRSRVLGWALLGAGLASTIPLASMVFRRR
jgi:hypothetical protein